MGPRTVETIGGAVKRETLLLDEKTRVNLDIPHEAGIIARMPFSVLLAAIGQTRVRLQCGSLQVMGW